MLGQLLARTLEYSVLFLITNVVGADTAPPKPSQPTTPTPPSSSDRVTPTYDVVVHSPPPPPTPSSPIHSPPPPAAPGRSWVLAIIISSTIMGMIGCCGLIFFCVKKIMHQPPQHPNYIQMAIM